MLSELGIYERRLDRIEAGLSPFAFSVGGDGYVPTFVDASTLDEAYSLLYSAVSRVPPDETVVVEDLVGERLYRAESRRVLALVRNRYLLEQML